METVQKKFSKPHKRKLSKEEKIDKDLKDCMRCRYFWVMTTDVLVTNVIRKRNSLLLKR